MARRLKVLVTCEFSGIVREAFNRMGHEATSCDVLPSEIPGRHFQWDAGDVLDFAKWDLIINHPPCTYLCNSGVRWLFGKTGGSTTKDPARWALMLKACAFFASLYHADCERIAVENPVMHGHAVKELARLGVPVFSQSVQPYQFGHMETKRTCLWLRGLAPLVGTDDVETAMRKLPKSRTNLVHLASPGPERWAMRSRTYPGIAEAMAHQWGGRVSPVVNVPFASQPAKI